MTKIRVPEGYSTVREPVLFLVERESSAAVDVSVNGYLKQMTGAGLQVNVAAYYRDDLSIEPIEGHSEQLKIYGGEALQRVVSANISVGGVVSESVPLVESQMALPKGRFLTEIKSRPYVRGQMDELSVVSDDKSLGLSFQDSPSAGGVGSSIEQEYKSFSINTTEGVKRYALLVDGRGEVLDSVEFVEQEQCSGVRLCWVNRYGVIDYWNFITKNLEKRAITKSRIYTSQGHTVTDLTAEDTTTVTTQQIDEQTYRALMDILTSQRVWRVDGDSFTPIDVLTTSAQPYLHSALNSLQIEFRDKRRVL